MPDPALLLDLYTRGRTYAELAEQHGLVPNDVKRLITAHLKEIVIETSEEAKQLDNARIEVLLQTAISRYLGSGEVREGKLAADLLKMRASLFGYEAPKVNVNLDGGKVNYKIDGVDMDKL